MLHILLLILKIIGIVLLCILGVLLLCIGCALFVPLRYRIEAVRKEGEGEPPVVVTVKVTWLLHFVNVLVRFNGSLSVRARLMVFTLFGLPGREKRGKEKPDETQRRKEKRRRKTEKLPDQEEREGSETAAEKEEAHGSSGSAPERKAGAGAQTKSCEPEKQGGERGKPEETETDKGTDSAGADGENEANPDKKPSLWERIRAIPDIIRSIFAKIKSIFENIQYTIQNICDKMKSVSDTIQYYKAVIEGEPFQRSFALCKKELLTIFKHLKPDRFEAALIVGMDDPAATGEILAVCGILYPMLGPRVNVSGDFVCKRLEGRVFIRGKLRLFTFVRTAVRIYFNKDIRKLYGLLKKGGSVNG